MKHKKLRTLDELSKLPRNQQIVVTTGAFDVPHKAHRLYLKNAKEFGDVLILILQSDEFIKARKGEERPIRNQKIRLRRISGYEYVDYICIAEEIQSFYGSIHTLSPNTLVVSETTTDLETCPETMKRIFGSKMKVEVLKAKSDIHSTDIIKRRNLIKKPV